MKHDTQKLPRLIQYLPTVQAAAVQIINPPPLDFDLGDKKKTRPIMRMQNKPGPKIDVSKLSSL